MHVDARLSDVATASEHYPPPRVGWMAVAILFLLYVLSFLDRNLLALLIGPIRADLGASDFELSLLYGLAFGIFYAVAGLPAGWAIDRFQRRIVIFWGVIGWSLATAACGITRNFGVLFAARAGVGAGESTLVPGAQSMLSDLFPRDRLALPLSVWSLGAKIGQGTALIVGGALAALIPPAMSYELAGIGIFKGWQLIFLIVGLPGLLLAFLIFLIPEPQRTMSMGGKAAARTTYREYFRFFGQHLRFFVPHHLSKTLFLGISAATIAWAPAFLSRVHGWHESQIGLWLGTALLLGPLAGMPFHGAVVDHLYRRGWSDIHMRYVMIMAMLALPLGIAAFVVTNPFVCLALLGAFFFIICSCTSLPIVAVQSILPGHLRGKAASSMLLLINMSATTLGPVAVAALTDFIFGDPAKVGIALITCIAGALPLVALLAYATLKPLREMAVVLIGMPSRAPRTA